jgi:NAD(P)-dependent dehydrogenase (short-subunit alcohol dehydrogenase family)
LTGFVGYNLAMSVLITGASGGLGTAVCKAFTDAGRDVIAVARHWPEKMRFATLSADLTTAEGCNAMVEQALQGGPIEALVHLVGAYTGGPPLAETSDSGWDRMMNLNLRTAFLAMRAVLKPMLAAQHGRIVAIGARAGVEPAPNSAAYAVSKAGLVALVRNVAAECTGSGVTANAVLPSTMDTPLNRKAMPGADFTKWVTPESVAKLLVWLASDESADVSGAVIPIYGRA